MLSPLRDWVALWALNGACLLSEDAELEGAAAGIRGAGIEDDVVTFAVAVGLGDAEAEAGGFEGEGEFGEFSATLGGEFVLAGGRSWARRWRASARRPVPGHARKKEKAQALGLRLNSL